MSYEGDIRRTIFGSATCQLANCACTLSHYLVELFIRSVASKYQMLNTLSSVIVRPQLVVPLNYMEKT